MRLIAHRRNTIAELKATPQQYGVEVDIRSQGEQLIIHHEPFEKGILFEDWLKEYCHGTLILNVKEEGLEARLIKLMEHRGIKDFFFLDQSFPFLVKWARAGESRLAVRVSEFESIDTALNLAGQVDWVWIDCFSQFPLTAEQVNGLKNAGFKLCLVSPELQGRDAETDIAAFIKNLQTLRIKADAICTKRADLWSILGGSL